MNLMLFVLLCFVTFSVADESRTCWHIPENVWADHTCDFSHFYDIVSNIDASPREVTEAVHVEVIEDFFDVNVNQDNMDELVQKILEMADDSRVSFSDLRIFSNPNGGPTAPTASGSNGRATASGSQSNSGGASASTCACNFDCCKNSGCCDECVCHFLGITKEVANIDELKGDVQLHTHDVHDGLPICHHTQVKRVKLTPNSDAFYKYTVQSSSC